MTETIHITVESQSKARTILRLGGRLDFAAAPQLREEMEQVIAAGSRTLIVDLSQIAFVDSSGMGALLHGTRQTRQVGGNLVIVDPQNRLGLLLSLTALGQVLHVSTSLEDALYGLG